jgi:hypothetical protein
LLLLSILILSGCTGEVTTYYPLDVGNLWTFETTDLSSGSRQIHEELIVRRDRNTYTFRHGEKIINVGGKALVNKNGYTLLKTPFEAGRKWKEPGAMMEITAQGETYKVPADDFSTTLEVTMRIDRQDSEDPKKLYTDITVYRYAKDIRPISYSYRVLRPDGRTIPVFKSELKSFTNIKKK